MTRRHGRKMGILVWGWKLGLKGGCDDGCEERGSTERERDCGLVTYRGK